VSTSTETAVVVKKGRKFQVEVNGQPKGQPTTKKLAEAEAEKINGKGSEKPATAAPKAEKSTPPTPREQALKKLEGNSPAENAKTISKWQGLLGDLRDAGKPEQAKAVEEMIAVGDAWMAEHGEDADENPRAATARRAAAVRASKAAEADAAKAASEAAANAETTASGRRAPRASTVSKDGQKECKNGANCKLGAGLHPVTKFPTIGGDKRGDECRACRDARLAAKKAAS
jgi:hypothetical protein